MKDWMDSGYAWRSAPRQACTHSRYPGVQRQAQLVSCSNLQRSRVGRTFGHQGYTRGVQRHEGQVLADEQPRVLPHGQSVPHRPGEHTHASVPHALHKVCEFGRHNRVLRPFLYHAPYMWDDVGVHEIQTPTSIPLFNEAPFQDVSLHPLFCP